MPLSPETLEVESFRAGTLTSGSGFVHTYTADHVQQLATNINPEKPVPVVLGHPDINSPAFGWIKKGAVKIRDGVERLVLTLSDMKPEFVGWLKDKHYQNVSVKLWLPNDAHNPYPGEFSLQHLGFLGAAPSAVPDLQIASFSLPNESEGIEFSFAVDLESRQAWAFQSIAQALQSLRDQLIEEKGVEKVDELLPRYLIDDIKGAAEEMMRLTEDRLSPIPSLSLPYSAFLDGCKDTFAQTGKSDLAKLAEVAHIDPDLLDQFSAASINSGQVPRVINSLAKVYGVEIMPDSPDSVVKPDAEKEEENQPAPETTPDETKTEEEEAQEMAESKTVTVSAADWERMTKAVEKANANYAASQAENAALQTTVQALSDRITQQEVIHEDKGIEQFASSLISEGRLLPARKAAIIAEIKAMPNTNPVQFSADSPAKTPRQIYMDRLANMPVLFSATPILADDQELAEEFSAYGQAIQDGASRDSIRDDLRIKKYLKEHSLAENPANYAAAVEALDIDYTG